MKNWLFLEILDCLAKVSHAEWKVINVVIQIDTLFIPLYSRIYRKGWVQLKVVVKIYADLILFVTPVVVAHDEGRHALGHPLEEPGDRLVMRALVVDVQHYDAQHGGQASDQQCSIVVHAYVLIDG